MCHTLFITYSHSFSTHDFAATHITVKNSSTALTLSAGSFLRLPFQGSEVHQCCPFGDGAARFEEDFLHLASPWCANDVLKTQTTHTQNIIKNIINQVGVKQKTNTKINQVGGKTKKQTQKLINQVWGKTKNKHTHKIINQVGFFFFFPITAQK